MSLVEVEDRDGVAVVTMNRPKANALSPELVSGLSEAISAASGARALLLASAVPGMFSAGWDLPYLIDRNRREMETFVTAYCGLVRQLFVFGPPVVAALPGHAIAGGLILAMAADERIAAEGKARFGLSEVLLGVSVPACLMEPFRHSLGPRWMERLAATGENVPVERALGIGLVDAVVPPERLPDVALDRARALAALSPRAHAAIKQRSRAAAVARFDEALDHDPFLDFWFAEEARSRLSDMVRRLTARRES